MRALLRSLLILFITFAALITFLLTPTGLRTSVMVAEKFLPGKLTYGKISGVLIGPIAIDRLRYEDDQQIISIGHVDLNWLPSFVLKKQFHINTLKVDNLRIISKTDIPFQWNIQSIKNNINQIQQAISYAKIQINHSTITNIDIDNLATKQSFHLNEFYIRSLPTQSNFNTIFFATLKKPEVITLAGQLKGNPNHYTIDVSANGDQTDWVLKGTGDQHHILFTTPHTALLNGTLNTHVQIDLDNGIQWKSDIKADNINLSSFNPKWTTPFHFTLKGSGNQNGRDADPTFNIDLESPLNQHKQKIEAHLQGSLKQQTLTIHARLHHSAIDLHLTGAVHQNNTWTGTVDQLNFWIKDAATWRLQKSVTLSATTHSFSTSHFCLASPETGISCFQGKWDDSKMDVDATLDISRFKWLSAWTRFVKVSQGNLTANIRIDGDINNPHISSKIQLANSKFFFPKLNTTLSAVNASIDGDGRALNFTANAFSEKQPITAKGTIDLTKPGFVANANLTANNLLVANTDEYTLTASPNLMVAFKNKNIDITGKINIPTAIVRSSDYQSVTTLPNRDIVFIGNVTPPPKPFWNVSMDINVSLGNDVTLDNIAGFNATLGGNLRLLQTNSGELFGTGRIVAKKGMYFLYGQTLTLSPDSHVDFSNSPLADPSLNIKASKTIQRLSLTGSPFSADDLIVGLHVQGTVHSPKFDFYSNRSSLSQADILSYILLGYGSSSPIPGNTDLMLRALSAVKLTSQGLLGKQNIATQIESGLGLSELGVESETTVDAQGNTLDRQSAFVVGKNITRRLYARYSIGILDPVNVFQVRYLINRQWAVQTDSSTLGNGADVLYTIAKD